MSSDFEGRAYDLGKTSVRLVRVGKVIQVLFEDRAEARLCYDELATRFSEAESKVRGRRKSRSYSRTRR